MESVLLAVVMATLLVIVMSLALFDMFSTKTIGAGLISSWTGFLSSYLFSPAFLGVRPPLGVYFGFFFASTSDLQLDPLNRIVTESLISTAAICSIVGLALGVGVGALLDTQKRTVLTL